MPLLSGPVCAMLLALWIWFAPAAAFAHEFRPALLSLEELAPGRFAVRWVDGAVSTGGALELEPAFPAACQWLEPTRERLDCGPNGLVGEVRFAGLENTTYRVIVQIEWLGGSTTIRVVNGETPALVVQGASAELSASGLARLAWDYVWLGVDHILTGIDHVFFVIGLVLLVGFRRLLLWTVTAFTLAHSLTLAAAALGLARVSQPPIETCIALSILLVAVECTRTTPTLGQRAPWLLAAGFGLLHGFGFAGALAEVGLPPHQTTLGLAFFNLGVELGQLGIISLCWLGAALTRRFAVGHARGLRRGAVYALGSAAAFWTLERLQALIQS